MTEPRPTPGDFRVTMMLCNYATVSEQILYISGGGWSYIDSQCGPTAIAMVVGVPWDQTNRRIDFQLDLRHADGNPVQRLDSADDVNPVPNIQVRGQLEVGRPLGLAQGAHVDWPIAIPLPPWRLPPVARLIWHLTLHGVARHDWTLPFQTRA